VTASGWGRGHCATVPRHGGPGVATPSSTCGAMPSRAPPPPEHPDERTQERTQGSTPMTIYYRDIDSPVGTLTIATGDAGLHAIEFPADRWFLPRDGWQRGDHPLLDRARAQLDDYFAG